MKTMSPGLAEAPAKKAGKSWISKTIAWIHLWPSLVSAVILIFVCITGTIIVYCDEVIDLVNRDALYVPEVKPARLPAENLIAAFKREYPKRSMPGYMVVYKDPKRSVKFNSFERGKGLSFVFMDPYTGKVLKEDKTIYFFYITAHLHNSLLWHGVGEWIIDIATIIFLIELITGLVLWWPAKWTKSTRDASFKVKWKAKFKRVNYDLHNVFGFYALSISLILTVTGLIIAFHPLAEWTISTFGGDPSHAWEEKMPTFQAGKNPSTINGSVASLFTEYPDKSEAQVMTYDIDSAGFYMVRVANRIGLKSADSPEYAFFDRYTGHKLAIPETARLHEEIENVYWALHMGTWLGPVGKLLTFIGGIICTSLPITGFLIWWGRRKKKPGKNAGSMSSGKPTKKFVPKMS